MVLHRCIGNILPAWNHTLLDLDQLWLCHSLQESGYHVHLACSIACLRKCPANVHRRHLCYLRGMAFWCWQCSSYRYPAVETLVTDGATRCLPGKADQPWVPHGGSLLDTERGGWVSTLRNTGFCRCGCLQSRVAQTSLSHELPWKIKIEPRRAKDLTERLDIVGRNSVCTNCGPNQKAKRPENTDYCCSLCNPREGSMLVEEVGWSRCGG